MKKPTPGYRIIEDDAMDRPPLPSFTTETAAQKAPLAQDTRNMHHPAHVALAYTTDNR
jgi:nuclear transport factor 2 (NTF2) superfamily protein